MSPPFFVAQGATIANRREHEFTGVGECIGRSWRSHLGPKGLTCFRESATLVAQSNDFSPLYPHLYQRTASPPVGTEVPFLRHFSVMGRGLKT
jgi:hypothetical protein